MHQRGLCNLGLWGFGDLEDLLSELEVGLDFQRHDMTLELLRATLKRRVERHLKYLSLDFLKKGFLEYGAGSYTLRQTAKFRELWDSISGTWIMHGSDDRVEAPRPKKRQKTAHLSRLRISVRPFLLIIE